ncbi:MAG: tetratricopeptide repeat-containing glycosyltransferase family 2 protein [Thermodesulfobacteriota bacterium]
MKKGKGIKLSLCMIVKNEAHNLKDCIHPLKSILDEIIVVDTGSTDQTKEVAKSLGAKVFDFQWCNDFSAARNDSIRHATGDYILWLDADDRIDEQNIKKIGQLKNSLSASRDKAYYLIINSQSPVDGETRFRQIRIFPKIKGTLFEGRVHEQIYYSLKRQGIKFENMDIEIRHIGYSDSETIIKKAQRNLSIIESELSVKPNDLILHYNAARTLAMIGRKKEAIYHMKIITKNKNIRKREKQFYLECALLMGKYYVELGSYGEAVSIFSELSKDFKDNALVHFCLGQAYFHSRNYDQAIKHFHESLLFPLEVGLLPINLNQLRYDLHYSLGQCFLEKGQNELAKNNFLRSLQFRNDLPKSYQALGLLYLKEGNFEEAIKYYEKVILSERATDQDYTNVGLAYRKLGLYNQAEEAFQKALEINPQRIEALTNLGHLYYANKDYYKAEEFFKMALTYDANLIDIRLILSDIYFRFYEIENLISQCDALLRILNLPRHITINNFAEINALYKKMAEIFSALGQERFALLAWKTAFLIYPQEEILEMIINKAITLGLKEKIIRELNEIIEFYKQKEKTEEVSFLAN